MQTIEALKERARQALDKEATLGEDIRLDDYELAAMPHRYLVEEEFCELPEEEQKRLTLAGMDVTGQERSGTYFQKDASVVHCSIKQEGIEIIPIKRALVEKEYDWIWDYYSTLVPVDTDKYTASAELNLHDGYVIRALPGAKSVLPVQACLYIDQSGFQQNVHNILVAEEGSELHVISGCSTGPHLERGLHIGISEFFVHENAKMSFTMVHNWAAEMVVRPRSVARVEKGGVFTSNYIAMEPCKSLQMYPTTHLEGEDAVARFYTIIAGSPGSVYDAGGRVYLKKPGTRAEIVARAISNGARVVARGHLIGQAPDIKAHLECRGLLLNGGVVHAVPELEGQVDGVEMSHEAAVGKIAEGEIQYLMSRGLTEDEAISTIVRGFLNVDIPGLPPALQAQIDHAVDLSDKEAL